MTPKPAAAGCLAVHRHWLLTPHRAAFHRPTATAVVSDLHLGYDLARRRSGEAVPARGLDEWKGRLDRLVHELAPRRLVIAGDLVENSAGIRLADELLDWLARTGVRKTIIIPGNHDRTRWVKSRPNSAEDCQVGAWTVVHGDGELPDGILVLGHFHPILRLSQGVEAPCYLVSRRRIVLPAFSDDARGVNVLGDARWRSYRCAAIVSDEVLDFGLIAGLLPHIRASAGLRGRTRRGSKRP